MGRGKWEVCWTRLQSEFSGCTGGNLDRVGQSSIPTDDWGEGKLGIKIKKPYKSGIYKA
jgi:hypothetical protein